MHTARPGQPGRSGRNDGIGTGGHRCICCHVTVAQWWARSAQQEWYGALCFEILATHMHMFHVVELVSMMPSSTKDSSRSLSNPLYIKYSGVGAICIVCSMLVTFGIVRRGYVYADHFVVMVVENCVSLSNVTVLYHGCR